MKIKLKLSKHSINQAIKQLEQYRNNLEIKQERLMMLLASRGYEIIINKLNDMDMPFSRNELISGAMFNYSSKHASIFVISDHAIYVEFGTGIVGAQSPNPNNTIGYAYDINGHGDNGWYYYDENGIHWTKGMPSRPFVHETYVELREEINSIVKEVFDSGR